MATVKDAAQAYEPPQSKNIADLEKVSVELDLKEDTARDNEGKDFTYKYIEIENIKYRVPGSVLGGLKAILGKMPQLEYFTVLKTGTGMATKYQVLPWYAEPPQKVLGKVEEVKDE